MGISTDGVAENAAFAQKFDFPYPLLCDSERHVSIAYGACQSATAGNAKRITYVIGADGTVLQAHAEVDARQHPESLLATL